MQRAYGNDRISYGLALGSGLVGADLTWRPTGKLLLSASGNAHQNFEGVVHTILPADSTLSVGLGLFYRSERHGMFGNKCERNTTANYWFCTDPVDQRFRVDAFGLRLTLYGQETPVRFYVGYAPKLKRPVLSITASMVPP